MSAKTITLPVFYKEFTNFREEMTDFKKDSLNKFDQIDGKLANHTVALISIESKLDLYADMYYTNKAKTERLDERVTKLENE